MSDLEQRLVRCYALRRVNPFLGVLQIIETDFGRASSANGLTWEIEISELIEVDLPVAEQAALQKVYHRQGLWSQAQGLVHRPLTITENNDEFRQQVDEMIQLVQQHIKNIPFSLQDNIEYWLLDKDNVTPLVLMASSVDEASLPRPLPKYWKGCLGLNGAPSQRRFPQIDDLEFLIKERAGFNRNYQSFKRDADGGGINLMTKQILEADYFPAYLIQTHWLESIHRHLVHDYIEWIAPALLTLEQLNLHERDHLEDALSVQATSIEHHWRLFPCINDEAKVKAARVQCQLQQAQ